MEPLQVLLKVGITRHVVLVLVETGLIEVRLPLGLAIVLCGLVNLEWSFSTLRYCSAHEGSSIVLELGPLRLHFELVVAVEGSRILFVNTRCCVDLGTGLCLSRGCSLDLESSIGVLSVESVLVSLENGTLRFKLHFFAIELGLVSLVSLSFHVSWHDSVLHLLEGVSKDLAWLHLLSLAGASAKELRCGEVVL